jgi:hypothetical protein
MGPEELHSKTRVEARYSMMGMVGMMGMMGRVGMIDKDIIYFCCIMLPRVYNLSKSF